MIFSEGDLLMVLMKKVAKHPPRVTVNHNKLYYK